MITKKEIPAITQRTDEIDSRAGTGIVIFFTRSILPENITSF
jgi:hypothetical protein